jgi:hypothetical protein
LKVAWFQPLSQVVKYQVKNWFQALAFKFNMYRYIQALVKPGVYRGGDEEEEEEKGSARRRKKEGKAVVAGGGAGGAGKKGGAKAGGKGGGKAGGKAGGSDKSSTASLMQDAAQVPDLSALYAVCGVVSLLLFGLFFWIYRTFIAA